MPEADRLASITGLSAIRVPRGFDDDGLPVGLQLVADAGAESRLLSLAAAVQAA